VSLRIAILTYNWPPRNAIGTLRPYSWAKYLAQSGANVVILTARKQAYDEPLDLKLAPISGVEVIEVGPQSSSWKNSVVRSNERLARYAKAVVRFFRSVFGITVDPRDFWEDYSRAAAEALSTRVDVIVSTYGPRSAHKIAAYMKRRAPELVWLADYRDLWSGNHLTNYSPSGRRRERRLEKKTMAAADAIITVSDELAVELKKLLGKPTYVIPNGFDPDEVSSSTEKNGVSPVPKIVYTGMLYRNSRDPSPLFRALRELFGDGKLSADALTVEFYGPKDPWLEQLIEKYAVHHWVKVKGRVPRIESLRAQGEADMLLLLESGAPEARGVVTGKVFEYIAARRPILSVGSGEGSAIARLLSETGAGRAVGEEVDAIKEVLISLLQAQKPSWYQPNNDAIQKYSRKHQASQLVALAHSLATRS